MARKAQPRKVNPLGVSNRDVLPSGPLLAWLELWFRHHPGTSWATLQTRTGVPERSWLRARKNGRMHMDSIDKTLIELDGPSLAEMYPYEEAS